MSRQDAIRSARNRHSFPVHPAGRAGRDEAQRVLQQHREPQRSGAQQRPADERGRPVAVPQGAGSQHRVRLFHHLQHFQVHPQSAGEAGAAHAGGGRCEACVEPHEPDHHRLHAGAVSGSGRGADPGGRGESGCDLAADFARCAEHPHAAQPLHRFPQGCVAQCQAGRCRQSQPDRRRPAQPVPGLHARRVSRVLRQGAGAEDTQAGQRGRCAHSADRLSAGSAQLGDRGRGRCPQGCAFLERVRRGAERLHRFLPHLLFAGLHAQRAHAGRTCISPSRWRACCCSTTIS